ncbi:hypothetical protein [Kitasatospora herbaricolor]|uniref:hypothetical protein n=1 Tax=Kitasatospora herbaricolor TaxID=68217 RepID=UPI0036DB8DAF
MRDHGSNHRPLPRHLTRGSAASVDEITAGSARAVIWARRTLVSDAELVDQQTNGGDEFSKASAVGPEPVEFVGCLGTWLGGLTRALGLPLGLGRQHLEAVPQVGVLLGDDPA